jgi:hypothetical protein
MPNPQTPPTLFFLVVMHSVVLAFFLCHSSCSHVQAKTNIQTDHSVPEKRVFLSPNASASPVSATSAASTRAFSSPLDVLKQYIKMPGHKEAPCACEIKGRRTSRRPWQVARSCLQSWAHVQSAGANCRRAAMEHIEPSCPRGSRRQDKPAPSSPLCLKTMSCSMMLVIVAHTAKGPYTHTVRSVLCSKHIHT